MQAIQRLVRFLKGSPRCLVISGRQGEHTVMDDFSDGDWAGCAKTRRSTSSSHVMLGGVSLPRPATTQHVVATSSDEAEFYALTRRAMAADLAKVVKSRVSGRHRVEGDVFTTRSRQSASPSYPSFVGPRSSGPTRADRRESARVRTQPIKARSI